MLPGGDAGEVGIGFGGDAFVDGFKAVVDAHDAGLFLFAEMVDGQLVDGSAFETGIGLLPADDFGLGGRDE